MEALSDTLVRRLLDALLGAARLWSRREPLDEGLVAAIMELLALERHRAYVEQIPVYRELAEEQGLAEAADIPAIVGGMMLSTDVFKSYAPEWLEEGDFGAMSDWLADVSSCRPRRAAAPLRDIAQWRADLARQGIQLSSSSGTSGRPSFVPRDGPTWAAMCGNGRYYAVHDDAGQTAFDLLALMPEGTAFGLQAAATGLARAARRTHFLKGEFADALAEAVDYVATSADERQPLLVFGTPYHAVALCDAVLAAGRSVSLAPGSRLVTGGGWKGERALTREALHALVAQALGLDRGAVVDGYSATELNCVLSTCSHDSYHVPPLIQPILLDEALDWIASGEGAGILGFFDPFAGSYPGFIVTGDHGELTREPCACGLAGWSVRGEIVRAPGHEPRGCAEALAAEFA